MFVQSRDIFFLLFSLKFLKVLHSKELNISPPLAAAKRVLVPPFCMWGSGGIK